MKKEILINLVNKHYSSYKIAEETGKSQTTVTYWLRKYKLKTSPQWWFTKVFDKNNKRYKKCPICKKEKELNKNNFYMQSDHKRFHVYCKQCNNQRTLEKQRERKLQAIKYKGGKCQKCGYDKCPAAFDFHHRDPNKKEFRISQLRTYSLQKLKSELDKCDLLCANCHRELHYLINKK